jgi:hypothetical protein
MTLDPGSRNPLTFVKEPDAGWATPLTRRERDAITAAFDSDRVLRVEVEALLRNLARGLHEVFERAYAKALIGLPTPTRPTSALLPALGQTAAVAIARLESSP